MHQISFLYNGLPISISFNKLNIHIVDSYRVKKAKEMKEILHIVHCASLNRGIFYARNEKSWIREWKAHNLLYKLGICKTRTQSVDLNENESKLRKIGYFFLSLFC